MRKLLLLTAAFAVGATFAAPVRAEDQSEAPAASAAQAETPAPAATPAPAQTSAPPAAESKPAIPPDSEWVHPTK